MSHRRPQPGFRTLMPHLGAPPHRPHLTPKQPAQYLVREKDGQQEVPFALSDASAWSWVAVHSPGLTTRFMPFMGPRHGVFHPRMDPVMSSSFHGSLWKSCEFLHHILKPRGDSMGKSIGRFKGGRFDEENVGGRI